MPRKARQAFSVWFICIIEARILSFDAIKSPVEVGRLNADFRDEVASNVSGKRGRVLVRARSREEVFVDQLGDRRFMHDVRVLERVGGLGKGRSYE